MINTSPAATHAELPRNCSTNARSGTPDTALIPYIVAANAAAPNTNEAARPTTPMFATMRMASTTP
jgi:hypothetical protein